MHLCLSRVTKRNAFSRQFISLIFCFNNNLRNCYRNGGEPKSMHRIFVRSETSGILTPLTRPVVRAAANGVLQIVQAITCFISKDLQIKRNTEGHHTVTSTWKLFLWRSNPVASLACSGTHIIQSSDNAGRSWCS